MKLHNVFIYVFLMFGTLALSGCNQSTNTEVKTTQAVQRQQAQYTAVQPIPVFNWSLERHLVTQLYQIRNAKAATHSVWRSDLGTIEGDCPSMGFSLPYDTSLTNPLMSSGHASYALTSIEQAEPNGIFASKNTAATWVMCVGTTGAIEPIYVETKVTVYPYPVKVNYESNRVVRNGKASISINKD